MLKKPLSVTDPAWDIQPVAIVILPECQQGRVKEDGLVILQIMPILVPILASGTLPVAYLKLTS